MIRTLLLVLVTALSLAAGRIEAHYDVHFSVFGKIGEADVFLETIGRHYHIRVEAGLVGTAASLGRNRREIHQSFGFIENGMLVPTYYKKERRSDYRHEDTYFVIDPEGTITKYRFRQKEVEESHFDIARGFYSETKVEKSSDESVAPYKATNDLLSLFFNVKSLMASLKPSEHVVKTAAGAKGKKGEILITNPGGEKRKEMAELMPDNDDRFVTVLVNQDIFESEKGELYINLDEAFLAKEAMLKDVLLFGDIRGKRVSQTGSIEIPGRP
jgi:5-hydroxyisourate hydrolase-like protein (transthyretin family)